MGSGLGLFNATLKRSGAQSKQGGGGDILRSSAQLETMLLLQYRSRSLLNNDDGGDIPHLVSSRFLLELAPSTAPYRVGRMSPQL